MHHSRRGAAAVEFVLLAPVLIGLLVVIVDLSNFMTLEYDVMRAAKDGAKVASAITLDPGEDGTLIEAAAVDHAVLVLAQSQFTCGTGDVVATWDEDLTSGYWMIRVDVDCAFDPLVLDVLDRAVGSFAMFTLQQDLP